MIVIDQMGISVEIPDRPQRIVSLVPSQTELLFDLGLQEQIVGLTKFCVHPEALVQQATIIGGTKNFKFEVIERLQPDLIIGNKEENYLEGIERLKRDYPVWMSDIENLPQALEMMQQVGTITRRSNQARELAVAIEQSWQQLLMVDGLRCAYLIWREPYMSVGQGTFIDDALTRAGYHNVFKDLPRYPEISIDDLRSQSLDVLMLSSEPYPFADQHIKELQQSLPDTRIVLVDGEMFSWYGSRLLKSTAYLNDLAKRISISDC